jgi:hypothetical protein
VTAPLCLDLVLHNPTSSWGAFKIREFAKTIVNSAPGEGTMQTIHKLKEQRELENSRKSENQFHLQRAIDYTTPGRLPTKYWQSEICALLCLCRGERVDIFPLMVTIQQRYCTQTGTQVPQAFHLEIQTRMYCSFLVTCLTSIG